VLTDLLY